MFIDATPAKWKVFNVIWVPGSPILWAQRAPTAVPSKFSIGIVRKNIHCGQPWTKRTNRAPLWRVGIWSDRGRRTQPAGWWWCVPGASPQEAVHFFRSVHVVVVLCEFFWQNFRWTTCRKVHSSLSIQVVGGDFDVPKFGPKIGATIQKTFNTAFSYVKGFYEALAV